jgi:hypothetical protein
MPDALRESEDDASIDNGAYLLRKVHPTQMGVDDGALRITSNAFHDITDRETGKSAVSGFVESKLEELGASPADLVAGLDGFGVVALPVSAVRELGLGVTWEPNSLSFGDAHVHINGKKNRTTRQKLAERCEYRVWPSQHPR